MQLELNEEEAEMLLDILKLAMNEMSSMNSLNRFKKPPLLTEEEGNVLHESMRFCGSLMKKIYYRK